MKLQVRSTDTTIFYPLATWSWDSQQHHLIQRIPRITEVRVNIPGKTKSPSINVPEHMIRPSLQTGQEVRLDDVVWYVSHIEVIPPGTYDGVTYVYYLSELAPEVPAFWIVEVTDLEKHRGK